MAGFKTRKNLRADDAGVDMTSMLDIVFIMLIFFIVTAVFIDETGLDFTQAPPGPIPPEPTKTISIYVYANGSARINGAMTDMGAVPARIETLRASLPTAPVSVRAEYAVPLDDIVFIKDSMQKAKIPVNIKMDDPV